MLKKLLFFFLIIISFRNSFSQELILIEGRILSSEGNSKVFGATIYLTQNDILIAKSISNQNGRFFIKSPVSSKGKFDLLVRRNGYLDYKILLDLTTIDFLSKKSISLKLNNDNNIILSPIKNTLAFDYSEKYAWSQSEFLLVADETYRIQIETAIKESINISTDIIVKTDSVAIKAKDEKVIKDVNLIFTEVKLLSKDKNYKAAIDKYSEAELLLISLSNSKNKSVLLSQIETDKKNITKLKNSDDQAFNSQILKAKENYALGRRGYAKAKIILGTAPMKSRANDPELIELIEKIQKMESYYSLKDAAYILVKSKKKNQEAIDFLLQTLKKAESFQILMPSIELSQLKKSIDSLQKIVNPMMINQSIETVIPPSTSNPGIILLAPGEIYTGVKSDAYEDVLAYQLYKKNEVLTNLNKVKNDLDYKAYYDNILDESISQDYQSEIKRRKDEIEKINISAIKKNDTLQLQIQNSIIVSDSLINNRNLQVKANNMHIDSSLIKRRTEIDYAKVQKDSIAKVQSEEIVNRLHNMSADQKPPETTPNYLKNEDGVLYEKNKMTEVIYKIKNIEGFVSSIVRRRVVVDDNGYGIVYEHTTNESGESFYSRNCLTINETIWFNESTGIDVIKK